MARPKPQTTKVVFKIDTSGFHFIDRLSPGPLGLNDAFDPNLPFRLELVVNRKPFASSFHLLPENSLKLPSPDEMFAESEFKRLKGKISDTTVQEYVTRRTKIFGSTALYEQFATESDKELADNPGLRKLIEMGGKSEKDQYRQTVFYRWVRKAYLDSGAKDVPSLIKTGKSERLKKALTEVQAAYGGTFKVGGFNPRPQKNAKYQYILGTISDHALGLAIDIEDRSNPILSAEEWNFLEDLTDKKVSRTAVRWKTSPKALWQDIQDVNDLFVAKLQKITKAHQEQEAAKSNKEAAAKKVAETTEAVKKATEAKDKATTDADKEATAKALTAAQEEAKKATDALAVADKALADSDAANKAAIAAKTKSETDAKAADDKNKAALADKTAKEKVLTDTNNATKANAVNVFTPSTPIIISVKPNAVNVTTAPANAGAVKRGDKVEIKVTLQRVNGFAGAVTLELVPPPGVVGLAAEKVAIPADKAEGTIIVTATADATEGAIANAVIRASADFDGAVAASDGAVAINVTK